MTETNVTKIAELWREGLSLHQVAEMTGVSHNTVHRYVCRLPEYVPTRPEPIDTDLLLDYNARGYSYERIGAILGYSPDSIRKKLYRLGIKQYAYITEDEVAEMLRLWDTGLSAAEVARCVGRSGTMVLKIIRQHREYEFRRPPPVRPWDMWHK